MALDYQRIGYGTAASAPVGTRTVGANNPAPCWVAPGGPGFGWRDIDVLKLGAKWRVDSA